MYSSNPNTTHTSGFVFTGGVALGFSHRMLAYQRPASQRIVVVLVARPATSRSTLRNVWTRPMRGSFTPCASGMVIVLNAHALAAARGLNLGNPTGPPWRLPDRLLRKLADAWPRLSNAQLNTCEATSGHHGANVSRLARHQ